LEEFPRRACRQAFLLSARSPFLLSISCRPPRAIRRHCQGTGSIPCRPPRGQTNALPAPSTRSAPSNGSPVRDKVRSFRGLGGSLSSSFNSLNRRSSPSFASSDSCRRRSILDCVQLRGNNNRVVLGWAAGQRRTRCCRLNILAIRAKWLATRERNDGDGEKRESEWSMHNKVTSY